MAQIEVSILEYENLVIGDDWTHAIQTAIDDVFSLGGGVVSIPVGTYNHKGIALKTMTVLRGKGNRSSVLKNTGTNSSITIDAEEEIVIESLNILGNNAGAGEHGITLNGSSNAFISIKSTRINLHGGNGIYGGHGGHINNLLISGCIILSNGLDGINLQYGVGQINAIWIEHNDVSWNKRNGVVFFGNNIIVESNTMQANGIYGVSVGDSSLKTAFCFGSKILNNYTEQNGYSLIENASVIGVFSGAVTGESDNKIIRQLTIANNFFAESGAKYNSIIHCIDLKNSNASNKNNVLITKNNYGNKRLITLNKDTAISHDSIIEETEYVLIDNLIETLPRYVKVITNQLKTRIQLEVEIGWGVTIFPQYYVDTSNRVLHLMGNVSNGSGLIATIPVYYAPVHDMKIPVITSTNEVSVIGIYTNGGIHLESGNNVQVRLDGISYFF